MVKGSVHPRPPHQWTADWGPAKCQPAPPPAPDPPPALAPPDHLLPWLEPRRQGALGRVAAPGCPARREQQSPAQRPHFHPRAGSTPLREGAGPPESSEWMSCSGSWPGGAGAAPPTWCAPRWPSAAGEQRERERGAEELGRGRRGGVRETEGKTRRGAGEREEGRCQVAGKTCGSKRRKGKGGMPRAPPAEQGPRDPGRPSFRPLPSDLRPPSATAHLFPLPMDSPAYTPIKPSLEPPALTPNPRQSPDIARATSGMEI